MEPYGTPHVNFSRVDFSLSQIRDRFQLLKYLLNLSKALPRKP